MGQHIASNPPPIGATLNSGTLRVASAFPDPPFELIEHGTPAGFDVDWMQAIAADLSLQWQFVPYDGSDFNGIFRGLDEGTCDCVASGATITPGREAIADFCEPYYVSGQSLVVNVERSPQVHSVDDLVGLILGVQHGNTSEPVAERLCAEGRIAEVRKYAYHDIPKMLDDVESGAIAAAMKLGPVMHWLTRSRPALRVVQERITDETLGIAVRKGNDALRQAINDSQRRLRDRGKYTQLAKKWLEP